MAKEYWLKSLGMGARAEQMPDDWRRIRRLTHAATFRRHPSVKTGDEIAYYASGKGIVFATGRVRSHPYEAKEVGAESNWPWQVDVDIEESVEFIHNGVPLEDLNVGERDLRRSIRQKSHVRLTPAEYRAAVEGLRSR